MASDLRSELSADAAGKTSATTAREQESAANEGQTVVEVAERVDLNLVSDQPEAESRIGVEVDATSDSEVSEPADAEDSESHGIPLWLALIGLVIAALVVGYQMRLNGQLEAEVMGLEAKLGRTQSVLDAHKTHLGDIRGGVRDLSAQLQSLQTLVETEPVVARDSADVVVQDVVQDESAPAQP